MQVAHLHKQVVKPGTHQKKAHLIHNNQNAGLYFDLNDIVPFISISKLLKMMQKKQATLSLVTKPAPYIGEFGHLLMRNYYLQEAWTFGEVKTIGSAFD